MELKENSVLCLSNIIEQWILLGYVYGVNLNYN